MTAFFNRIELLSSSDCSYLKYCLAEVVKAPTCPVSLDGCRVLLRVEDRILKLPALFELPLFLAGKRLSSSSSSCECSYSRLPYDPELVPLSGIEIPSLRSTLNLCWGVRSVLLMFVTKGGQVQGTELSRLARELVVLERDEICDTFSFFLGFKRGFDYLVSSTASETSSFA